VLVNDIVRYWRIVLLNYEAKNAETVATSDDSDRRLRSYKLRFSRCLTCYSAICFLLGEARSSRGNIARDSVLRMVQMTPLERLRSIELVERPDEQAVLSTLRDLYARFLEQTNVEKRLLLERFGDPDFRRARSDEARQFGENLFRLLESLGRNNPLYRFVLV
jgi:hypothetical protein